MTWEADGVLSLVLVDPEGGPLPSWTPGAHVKLGPEPLLAGGGHDVHLRVPQPITTAGHRPVNDPVLGEVTLSEETDVRPVAVLEVDGVLVLEDPVVPVTQVRVHAYGHKWARYVRVPTAAPGIVARLAERFDIVWAGAWSHNAHPALREVLGLPERPWPFLPVQFRKLPAIRAYAAGRAWVLIDDSIHDFGLVGDQPDGLLVPVDPGRGITAIDPDALRAELDRHCPALMTRR